MVNDKELRSKVHAAMYKLIKDKGVASPVEVLMEIGLLSKTDYERWRFGKVQCLERICQINLRKLSLVNNEIRVFVNKNNLKPSWNDYRKWGKGKPVRLRFSKSGDENVEKFYATHYVSQSKVSEAIERRTFQKLKNELAQTIAPCGLICGLCSDNAKCRGCPSGDCGHAADCYQRTCCAGRDFKGCWNCPDFPCVHDMFSPERDVRLRAFVRCAKEDGLKALADYVLRNQDDGILYHRNKTQHTGDYDCHSSEETVLALLRTGKIEQWN